MCYTQQRTRKLFQIAHLYSTVADSVHETPININGFETGLESVFPAIVACYGSNVNVHILDVGKYTILLT